MRCRVVSAQAATVDAEEPDRLADWSAVETSLLRGEDRLLGEDERAVKEMTDGEAAGGFRGEELVPASFLGDSEGGLMPSL